MQNLSILFFGSTSDSLLVLVRLFESRTNELTISAIVTQPPRPVGRKQILTPTPVELWAKKRGIPVLSFPSDPEKPWLYQHEQTVIDTLQPFRADLFISACYGQKIPTPAIHSAKSGGLNVHPSLLPRWRGADPVPWAIFSGDRQTGVTIVTLEEKFDEGKIIAQKKIPITDKDYPDPLRTKLFTIGADLLVESLPDYISGKNKGITQATGDSRLSHDEFPYARRLTRDDGYEAWETIQNAFENPKEAIRIERKFRAFSPWPGLWTKINGKRLKILSCHLTLGARRLILDTVQLEGKTPVSFDQFSKAYLPS